MAPDGEVDRRVAGLVAVVVILVATQLGVATAGAVPGHGHGATEAPQRGSASATGPGVTAVSDRSMATSVQEQSPDVCGENIETLVSQYNENAGAIPGFVRFIVTNKQVHLAVSGADGGDYTIATSGNGTVQSYSTGEPAGARVRMETDCAAVRQIVGSNDPLGTFWDAYWAGEVDFTGNGILWFLVVEGVELLLLVSHALSSLGIPLVVALTVVGILLLGIVAVGGLVLLVALYLGYRYYTGSDSGGSSAASGHGAEAGAPADQSSPAESGEATGEGDEGSEASGDGQADGGTGGPDEAGDSDGASTGDGGP